MLHFLQNKNFTCRHLDHFMSSTENIPRNFVGLKKSSNLYFTKR